jgi:transcriptional repressor NF-X1
MDRRQHLSSHGDSKQLNVLESDASASSVPGNEWRRAAPRTDASYSAIPNAGNAGPSATKLQPDVDVDDWEEACE